MVILISERKKQVKVIRNKNSQQCLISIPKSFWDLIPKSGYFELTEQNGNLLLTPTQKKQSTEGIAMPVFEEDSSKPAVSSQEVTNKEEVIQGLIESSKKKINPSINPEKEQNVWEDDGSETPSVSWD
jgi:hypothetical protein